MKEQAPYSRRRAKSAPAEDDPLFKLTADEEARLSALISRETDPEKPV